MTGSSTSAPTAPQAARASSCFGSPVLCRQPEQDGSIELAAAGRWQRCPEAGSAHNPYLHPTWPQRAPAAACSLNNRTGRLGTASLLPQSQSGTLEAAPLLAASAMRSLPRSQTADLWPRRLPDSCKHRGTFSPCRRVYPRRCSCEHRGQPRDGGCSLPAPTAAAPVATPPRWPRPAGLQRQPRAAPRSRLWGRDAEPGISTRCQQRWLLPAAWHRGVGLRAVSVSERRV